MYQHSPIQHPFKDPYRKCLGRYAQGCMLRDVSTGATGVTGVVAPKFSDTLTLFQPGGADCAHQKGLTN